MELRTVPIHNKTRYSANRVYISCDALYQHMGYEMSAFLILVVELRHCLRHEYQRNYYRNINICMTEIIHSGEYYFMKSFVNMKSSGKV